jgi:hypothetical protein
VVGEILPGGETLKMPGGTSEESDLIDTGRHFIAEEGSVGLARVANFEAGELFGA